MSAPARAVVSGDRRTPRTPPLAAVEWGYLVGRRRPLSELPPEKQQQIIAAYDETDWAAENDVEFFGFSTDAEAAQQKAGSVVGGFCVKLPVGAWLPEGAGRYTVQEHPGSPVADYYRQTSPGLETVERDDVMTLATVIERSCKTAGVS